MITWRITVRYQTSKLKKKIVKYTNTYTYTSMQTTNNTNSGLKFMNIYERYADLRSCFDVTAWLVPGPRRNGNFTFSDS